MKAIIHILFVLSFLLVGSFSYANNFIYSAKENTPEEKLMYGSSNQINVVGTTNNQNGQNSTIDLRVTGTSAGSNNFIIYVEYKDGTNWKKVTYSSMIGQKGKYYVTINSNIYYFEF
jgi:hypothetical protein